MYKRYTVVIFVLFIIMLCGCSSYDESETESDEQQSSVDNTETTFTVGISNISNDDFFAYLRIEKLETLTEENTDMELTIEDAQFDAELQLEQIDSFIEQGVSAVVITPVDYDAISTGIVKLNEAGIPVITFGIETSDGVSCYIGSPNVEAGRMQAEYLVDVLPYGATILYLEGDSDLYHSQERKEGFLEVIESKRLDITILDSEDADYDEDTAKQVMAEWIEEYDDFDAVVAANDLMALGAISALKENDRLDGVIILGIDGSNERALEAIKNGELTMTLYQNAEVQAAQCLDVLEALRTGEGLSDDIIVPFEEITIDNVIDYINLSE